jgi:hypothetical protein
MNNFHDFCKDQIERLGSFPDFRFYKQSAIDELTAWLEEHAAGSKANATVFITEVTQWENLPKISDLNSLWRQMFPKPEDVRRDCERCGGSGWIEVQGKFGLSAAYQCHHGPVSDADRRMGVRLSPALRRHYSQEQIAARERAKRWVGSGGKPVVAVVAHLMEGV